MTRYLPYTLILLCLLTVVPVSAATGTYNVVIYPQSDGLVYRGSVQQTFNAIITGAGTGIETTDPQSIGSTAHGITPSFNIHRRYVLGGFDTTIVGSTGTITAGTLYVYGGGTATSSLLGTNVWYGVVPVAPGNPLSIASGDYQLVSNSSLYSNWVSQTSWTTSGNNSFALTAAGLASLNKTGVSSLALENSWDYFADFNGTWSASNSSKIYFRPLSATNKPFLALTFTVPPINGLGINQSLLSVTNHSIIINSTAQNTTMWNVSYGDGTWYNTSGTFTNQTHTYHANGAYGVYEIVTGDGGTATSSTTTVTIGDTFGCPATVYGEPVGGGTGYSQVYLAGNASITNISTNYAQFIAALSAATSGSVIFIPSTADINFTGVYTTTQIPGNITIAGDRGTAGSLGGLIHLNRTTSDPTSTVQMLEIAGNNTRITGLRIIGPDYDYANYDSVGRKAGIMEDTQKNITIDNCEIAGWSSSGISIHNFLEGGVGNDISVEGLAASHIGDGIANIHHNYIHNNQGAGYGYGILVSSSTAYIYGNVFDYNRHSIAAGGGQGTLMKEGYEAEYNIQGSHSTETPFDVHGYPGGDVVGAQAGDKYIFRFNTANYTSTSTIGIRGKPATGVWIDHNNFSYYYYSVTVPHPITYRQSNNYGNMAENIGWNYINGYFNETPSGFFYSKPNVDFNCTPLDGSEIVSCTDWSDLYSNTTSAWNWSFGDGTYNVSKNATHSYAAFGTYTVSLIATNVDGNSTLTKTGYIVVNSTTTFPTASFTKNATIGVQPAAIQFNDTSTNTPTMWNWSFGDGNWSNGTTQNVTHTYNFAGTFQSFLIASNIAGSNQSANQTITIFATPAPIASFTATVEGATVTFTDTSANATSRTWQYNAHATPAWVQFSTVANPSYTFTEGTYDINLTVTNAAGSDTELKTSYLIVSPAGEGTVFPTEPSDLDAAKARYAAGWDIDYATMHVIWLLPLIIGVALALAAFTGRETDYTLLMAGVISIAIGMIFLVVIFGLMSTVGGVMD